jgi:hypothetical protein
LVSPIQQHQTQHDEQRRLDIEENADRIDAFIDDKHVDAPKEKEGSKLGQGNAERIMGRATERRKKNCQNFVNRLAADPGLNAEPSAGDKSAQEGRDVGPLDPKGGPAIDRKRNAIARPGVGIEDHRDQHNQVAKENRQDRLRPIHAPADERGGEHISGDAGGHGNPERGEIPPAPASPLRWHRSQVIIEERANGQRPALFGGKVKIHGSRFRLPATPA